MKNVHSFLCALAFTTLAIGPLGAMRWFCPVNNVGNSNSNLQKILSFNDSMLAIKDVPHCSYRLNHILKSLCMSQGPTSVAIELEKCCSQQNLTLDQIRDNHEMTALHWAVIEKELTVVMVLLTAAGANAYKLACAPRNDGRTALFWAAFENFDVSPKIAKCLLARATTVDQACVMIDEAINGAKGQSYVGRIIKNLRTCLRCDETKLEHQDEIDKYLESQYEIYGKSAIACQDSPTIARQDGSDEGVMSCMPV